MENQAIEIGSREKWATFTINGYTFEAELNEALEQLGKIDRDFRSNANECSDCGNVLPLSIDLLAVNPATGNEQPKCGACGGFNVRASSAMLSRVAELLKQTYGVPRCAIMAASDFYSAIMELLESSKKKSGTAAE